MMPRLNGKNWRLGRYPVLVVFDNEDDGKLLLDCECDGLEELALARRGVSYAGEAIASEPSIFIAPAARRRGEGRTGRVQTLRC